jgi:superfamily II DNA or RNA helicase
MEEESVILLDRNEDQAHSFKIWKEKGGIGCLNMSVGYGKTYGAWRYVLEPMWNYNKELTAIIVVPNSDLQESWSKKVKDTTYQVYTIQKLYKLKELPQTDLLILDEVHKYLSPKFSRVFSIKTNRNTRPWILGLSGSLDNFGIREKLTHIFKLPILKTLSLDTSVKLGFNNKYDEYNYLITLSKEESYYWHEQDIRYNKLIAALCGNGSDRDYSIIRKILLANNIEPVLNKQGEVVKYKQGKKSGEIKYHKQYTYAMEKAKELNLDTETVIGMAVTINKIMKYRKNFFYNHPSKIEVIKLLYERFKNEYKILTFSMTNEFCDKIGEYTKTPTYHGYHTKKQRSKIMAEFEKVEYGMLNACMAINEGVDIPELDFIINVAYYSTVDMNTQRKGRGVRLTKRNKPAIIVNLVCKYHPAITNNFTQEQIWLRRVQKGKTIPYITHYEQIK